MFSLTEELTRDTVIFLPFFDASQIYPCRTENIVTHVQTKAEIWERNVLCARLGETLGNFWFFLQHGLDWQSIFS